MDVILSVISFSVWANYAYVKFKVRSDKRLLFLLLSSLADTFRYSSFVDVSMGSCKVLMYFVSLKIKSNIEYLFKTIKITSNIRCRSEKDAFSIFISTYFSMWGRLDCLEPMHKFIFAFYFFWTNWQQNILEICDK